MKKTRGCVEVARLRTEFADLTRQLAAAGLGYLSSGQYDPPESLVLEASDVFNGLIRWLRR